MFKVITDIKRIKVLNKKLKEQLNKVFTLTEFRKFVSPGGASFLEVRFKNDANQDVSAWAAFKKKNGQSEVNLFLQGQSGDTESMHIAVQLNFPSNAYNKRTAGVFIEDKSGKISVAHRGNLTLNGRLKRNEVLNEFSSRATDAQENSRSLKRILICAQDSGDLSKFILISELSDNAEGLANDLLEFAKQAREVARKLGRQKNQKSHSERSAGRTAVQS